MKGLVAVCGMLLTHCSNATIPADGPEYPTGQTTPSTQRLLRRSEPSADAGAPLPASRPDAGASLKDPPDLPDPTPLAAREQLRYAIEFDRGTIRPGEPERVCTERPVPSARRIGRFAFELWLGHELVERVRFDFPLLAAEAPPTGTRRDLHEAPRFAPGARVNAVVTVPASERATSARILDRATREATVVPWPPASAADPTAPRCPARAPAPAAGAIQQQ